ncbi:MULTISPECIES: hypothetical protein [Bradyrhizobium]|jgi:hypothetical protein|uniref:Uncharacterized protein n=2 Tax=Bradyrhizobium TaxID=374 RepID=A0ABY0QF76_9BRAD|nr:MULTISPECIES: hypothetical protein [Bradyrhizobium]SDK13857.1 hypothetical protein SAMN05444163_7332 [Bradyrhizobium ottawaense]SEE51229.1 hypothetical protein SAMN05444171_7799 [Bradyrhizobium lablabi]SHM51646.1 hypothetical protein SAMN05444321_6600 [Bradyrhizobium lablabi]
MRFTCKFLNPDTDERKSIVTSLTAAECRSIESLRKHKGDDTAEVTAEACALRRAYSEVPDGFRHVEPPTLVISQ